MDKDFSANDTRLMKGIAVILMLMHHLWAFPDRISGGALKCLIRIFDDSLIHHLGLFGKICVSMFFFLGGYGLYATAKNKKVDVIKQIKKIYLAYWKVFLVFVPIGFLFFSAQPPYCENAEVYARYNSFSWNKLISNFLGISNSLNGEWWFLKSYVFAILTFPLLKKIFEKSSAVINIFTVVILSILSNNVFPAIGNIPQLGMLNSNYIYYNLFCQGAPFISCFAMGMIFAKENFLVRLRSCINKNIKLNIFSDTAIIFIIIFLRQIGIASNLDMFFVPVFIIVCMDLLDRNNFVKNIIYNIGAESTNMWLIHSFFCYYFYFFVKLVVWSKWAIPSLLVLIALSFAASKSLNYLWKYIAYLFGKLIKNGNSLKPSPQI